MATRILSKSFSQLFDNSFFSTDEDLDYEELREYYSDLFQEEYFVKTQIIATKIVESMNERYTVYVIQIRLPFTEYVIEKRYNQFLDLYKKVERTYKTVELGVIPFPSKSLFGTFTEATIQQRRLLLDKFLRFLSATYKQEQIVEFLQFLEIKKRIEMLIRLPAVESALNQKQERERPNSDVEQVNYYLAIFNRNKRDLCRSFKDFEMYYFEKRPRFSSLAVRKLLYGDDDLQGLIHLCGKYDTENNCHLTCGAGLHLLSRLLDYEYNRDAELFNQIFGTTKLRDIMCLYFDKHIQGRGSRSCKVAAMKLLSCFMNYNPSIALDQILTEDEVIQEFEIWKTSQQTTSIKAESYFKF